MSEQDISTDSTRAIPRLFISYSHDSPEHSERVLSLAWALQGNGIDVELDQFHNEEIVDWPRWCNEQTSHEHSDFVVCVCTAEYRQRIEGKVPPEKGKGVYWEGSLLDDDLYDEKGNKRVIAILFDDVPDTSIPRFLRGWTHCRLRQFALSDPGYEQLIRILTRQAKVETKPLGPVPVLPPKRAPTGSREVTFGGPAEETPVRQKTGTDALGDSQSASAGGTPPSITIKDNRLGDPDPPILEIIPYKETPTVDEFLDRIRRSLTSPPRVPDPGSYGRQWILYSNGHYFHEMGRRWAQFIEGRQLDQRPLREVGINPGITLEVQPPTQSIVVINKRPLVGGNEEPLLLEYSDLKTVGGFLNRIQNAIQKLSADSYGTDWILYDPASGRYFDDIVKGDSRVLQAAGIATEDGDTFLDVRPPPHPGAAWRWWIGLKTELKVAVIGALFAIVVAIITGTGNLVVAINNRAKASPTPVVSATFTPASTPIPSATQVPAASDSPSSSIIDPSTILAHQPNLEKGLEQAKTQLSVNFKDWKGPITEQSVPVGSVGYSTATYQGKFLFAGASYAEMVESENVADSSDKRHEYFLYFYYPDSGSTDKAYKEFESRITKFLPGYTKSTFTDLVNWTSRENKPSLTVVLQRLKEDVNKDTSNNELKLSLGFR
jgi:TIR domain